MAPAEPTGLTSAIVVLVLLVAIFARRTYALLTGARYSPPRLFALTGFYVLLFALFGFTTLYAASDLWGADAGLLAVAYGAVVIGATWVARPYVRRIVRFEQRDRGTWYYRLPLLVPLLSLGLFVLRFGAELAIFGLSVTTSFVLPSSLPAGLVAVLVVIDLLFGASVGLLLGRAVGVYEAFRERSTASAGAGVSLGD